MIGQLANVDPAACQVIASAGDLGSVSSNRSNCKYLYTDDEKIPSRGVKSSFRTLNGSFYINIVLEQ